ncbi:MAG TPA: Hpt domain-containing protein [Burkholderiaceae bacterium]|nr:Hpt domain-containing protein [Burkholderiaceae bacterium]
MSDNTPDVIDRVAFAELEASAGADFALELVDTFLEEAPTMLAELRRAHAAANADAFRRAAHSLKSNSLTFGATELARQARALELQGLPADSAPLDALDAAYARAAAALKGLRHA